MKKIISLFTISLILLFNGSLIAQVWLNPNTSWSQKCAAMSGSADAYSCITNDSIVVNGTIAKTVTRSTDWSFSTVTEDNYLYANGDKLYMEMNGSFQLIYDMNLTPGDSIVVNPYNTCTVRMHIDSLSTIQVNSQLKRVQHVHYTYDPNDGNLPSGSTINFGNNQLVIEGMGTNNHALYWFENFCFLEGTFYRLTCFKEGSSQHILEANSTCHTCQSTNSISDLSSNQNKWTFYPNPVTDQFTISELNGVPSQYNLILKTITGKTVLEQTGEASNITIDVSNLPTGTYTATVKTNSDIKTFRFVK
ncbi:MAG: T9SS type A sorting domain-containing protein [Flavobacteriales bacterium]|nr:T9SS type A sorting domain-containing protein [Flavobacteriales bacterium]